MRGRHSQRNPDGSAACSRVNGASCCISRDTRQAWRADRSFIVNTGALARPHSPRRSAYVALRPRWAAARRTI
jgi:hypothetical protein